MIKLKVALLVLSVLAGMDTYAATGSSGFVKIKTLRAGAGFIRITGETKFTDPSNCSNDGTNQNQSVLVFEDTASYSEIVSFLLAARVSGEPVQFWLDGCRTDSGKDYPRGTFLYL